MFHKTQLLKYKMETHEWCKHSHLGPKPRWHSRATSFIALPWQQPQLFPWWLLASVVLMMSCFICYRTDLSAGLLRTDLGSRICIGQWHVYLREEHQLVSQNRKQISIWKLICFLFPFWVFISCSHNELFCPLSARLVCWYAENWLNFLLSVFCFVTAVGVLPEVDTFFVLCKFYRLSQVSVSSQHTSGPADKFVL